MKINIIRSKLLIVTFSTLITIVIIELFLVYIKYPYSKCENKYIPDEATETSLGHFDKDLGWDYNQNAKYHLDENWFFFNSKGFRIESPNKKIDFLKPRILFIGGSITFGHGLSYENTYASKIGHLLKNRFEIVNLGVQGYGTDQTLIKLIKHIDYINPLIIVYTFIPDHINRNVNFNRTSYFGCLSFPGTKPLFTLKNGELIHKQKPVNILKYNKIKTLLLIKNAFNRLKEINAKISKYDVKLTKQLIEEIELVGEKQKAKTYYIYYDENYDANSKDSDNYNKQLLKQLFTKNGKKVLPFIDFAIDLNGDYFIPEDNYHPNSKTTTLMAEKFVKKFGKEILQTIENN